MKSIFEKISSIFAKLYKIIVRLYKKFVKKPVKKLADPSFGPKLDQSKPEPPKTSEQEPTKTTEPPKTTKPDPGPWTLVLVINIGKTLLINALRKESIHKTDPDELYRSTQSLWFGEKNEFENSELASWFDKSKKVAPENESEYDVVLVQLELNYDENGFHFGASELNRMDAFEELKKNENTAFVSVRLPNKSYKNTYK